MTRPAQATAIDIACAPSAGRRLFDRIRRHFARVGAATTDQSRLPAIRPETLRDTGLPAEDLTGLRTHEQGLPFFLQWGFGRGAR